MKQNSTENMILRHLKDIKAKIEQKSINNIKLPFEGPFKDNYAGRSPERILCLNSVRLVCVTGGWLIHEDKFSMLLMAEHGTPRGCLGLYWIEMRQHIS